MKLIRQIALTTMLTVGAFSAITYVSCNKDACKDVVCQNGGTCSNGNCTCTTGYSGTKCETAVRTTYVGTYVGNGSDNTGGTYTGWGLTFGLSGSDATAMTMVVVDENTAPQLSFTVKLTSNTTFTVDSKTSGNFTYTGSGTISASSASLTLSEHDNVLNTTTVYTYSSMIR